MSECLYPIRPAHSPCKGSENIPFTLTVRNKSERGIPTSLMTFVLAIHSRSEIIVETATIELGSLNEMRIMES